MILMNLVRSLHHPGTTAVGAGRMLPSVFSSSFFAPSTLRVQNRQKHQYEPRSRLQRKAHKGRVSVRTGGSIKGSTLVQGRYGMRLKTDGVRLKAIQLKAADETIMRFLRPVKGKLLRRLKTNIPVCVKGNETRMGKGKGAFEYWACRVPTGKVVFEIIGDNVHETVAREAFRIAGQKLPGVYEFVRLGDLPKAGFKIVDSEADEKPNFFHERQNNPSRQYANVLLSKSDEVRKYMNR